MMKETANSLLCAGTELLGMNPFKSASSVHVPEPGTDHRSIFIICVYYVCTCVCSCVHVCANAHISMCVCMWKLEDSLKYCFAGDVYLVVKQCFTGS